MKKLLIVTLILFNISSGKEPTPEGDYALFHAGSDYTFEQKSSYMDFETAYARMSSGLDSDIVVCDRLGKVIAMKAGIAISSSHDATLTFVSAFADGTNAYISNSEVCYYIGAKDEYLSEIAISGYRGVAKTEELMLIPAAFCHYKNKLDKYAHSYYYADGEGDLVHAISTYSEKKQSTSFYRIAVDKAPAFMQPAVRYFSIDGSRFYLSPEDAVANRKLQGEHTIYYEYLSFRTPTAYTQKELSEYLSELDATHNADVRSAYLGHMNAFFKAQGVYGINAALELCFANHESAYGKSYFALDRNNFFGISAYDGNTSAAKRYDSVDEGVAAHAQGLLNKNYFDAYAYVDESLGTEFYDVPTRAVGYIADYRGDSCYFGSYLGNKATGINVRYASDPWHGEKIAAHMYRLDKALGGKDYRTYTIGKLNWATKAYSLPSKASFPLYKYASKDPDRSGGLLSESPRGIYVTVIGEYGPFYQVVSEMPVSRNRRACNNWPYNRFYSFAFVPKVDVSIEIAGTAPLNTSSEIKAALKRMQ